MPLDLRAVAYGRPASLALRDAIAAAQSDDPLAPVTVLVARGSVGLAMRRLLASGDLGLAPGRSRAGLCNVTFTTVRRLAEQLGGRSLAEEGRRPLSTAVLHAALRASLATSPGPFEPVRTHPSTVISLARLWRELRGAPDATRARLASGNARAAAVVALLDDATGRLIDTYDEHDLLRAATAAAQATTRDDALVVHLPERLEPAALELLQTLIASTTSTTTALLGITGDAHADEPAVELAAALGAPLVVAAAPMRAERLLSAPSAEVEVQHALRTVLDEHRRGTPLDRMAVLHATTAPHARLLHELLERNDIPSNGPGVRALHATVAGRTLLGLLALPDRSWRRNEVIDWLASAPIHRDGALVAVTAWDRVTRAAGIVDDPLHWIERLSAHRAALVAEHERALAQDASPGRLSSLQREVQHCDDAAVFVDALCAALTDDAAPRTWRVWAGWATTTLHDLLGGPLVWDDWPDDERQAVDEVLHALERLAALDPIDAEPTRRTFTQALHTELGSSAPTTSRSGVGLLVGPIGAAAGLDLDLVIIVGMTDGALPGRRADDALLPDDERAAADPTLPLRAARTVEVHREYRAAALAAPRRILCFPRGDVRTGREQRPSRWWLDALAIDRTPDRTLYAGDMATIAPGDDLDILASHTSTLLRAGEPIGAADHDLRLLAQHRLVADLDVRTHWLAQQGSLALGLEARAQRRSRSYTRFDGLVGARQHPTSAFSPTALQTYATCPRRHLLERVLRVEVPSEPERIVRIDARDRGSLIHAVLERFISRQLSLPPAERIAPRTPWGPDDHAALDQILDEVADGYVAEGRTGHRVLWAMDLRAVRHDLHNMLEADTVHRREHHATPHAVELPIGVDGVPAVPVQLRDGRTLSVRGYIDRLDTTDDGGAVVLDYKGGRSDRFKVLQDDPVHRGQLLQPLIYALMARHHLGDATMAVRTGYWFTNEASSYGQTMIDVDEGALARFDEVVTVLLDGITAGHHPARPGPYRNGSYESCTWCDYDSLCPSTRAEQWQRVRTDPRLAAVVALAEDDR